MKKISILILALPLMVLVACGGRVPTGKIYAEEFKPGDRAAVNVDIDGDRVGEMLVVASCEPDPELGLIFNLAITLTNPRGNVLYESEETGELDWFSVQKTKFEYETGAQREIALIRTGCSGTGVHVSAFLLYQPPRADEVMVSYDGNEGFYDSNGNGVPDVFVSRYRMQNLGVIGAASPWLPVFSRPSKADNWESQDVTFEVLSKDGEFRQEWVDGVSKTCDAIIENDFVELVGEEHLRYLKMLKTALEANDMEEARNIYYTSF
jgi:hypothetical protein